MLRAPRISITQVAGETFVVTGATVSLGTTALGGVELFAVAAAGSFSAFVRARVAPSAESCSAGACPPCDGICPLSDRKSSRQSGEGSAENPVDSFLSDTTIHSSDVPWGTLFTKGEIEADKKTMPLVLRRQNSTLAIGECSLHYREHSGGAGLSPGRWGDGGI